MDIDYQTLLIEGFITGLQVFAESFGTAFQANPLPFLGMGALLVLSALIPTRRARRRRRA